MGVKEVQSIGHCCEHLHLFESICQRIKFWRTCLLHAGIMPPCPIGHLAISDGVYDMTWQWWFIDLVLLAKERLGSSSCMRCSWASRKRPKLMPCAREGKVKKRGGMRTVTCGSSQPKPRSYNVFSTSSEYNCSTSNTLEWETFWAKLAILSLMWYGSVWQCK